MTLKIGIIKETASGERRVALDPPTAAKLVQAGHKVIVETGAGTESGHPDEAWADCEIASDAATVAAGPHTGRCRPRYGRYRPACALPGFQ
jgi:H+-translocating NAD(P) transhydrogenase subunit alpha